MAFVRKAVLRRQIDELAEEIKDLTLRLAHAEGERDDLAAQLAEARKPKRAPRKPAEVAPPPAPVRRSRKKPPTSR